MAGQLTGSSAPMLEGELLSHDGEKCVRVPGPTAGGQALLSDLAEPADMIWAAVGLSLPLTTKGDLLTRDASALVRVPVGTVPGHVPTVDPTASVGWKWAAQTGGGGGGGALPLTSLYLFDDWATGWAGSGLLSWLYSGTLTDQPPPESSHPGIARLYNEYISPTNKFQYMYTQEQTVTGSPPNRVLHGGSILPIDDFDLRWLMRLSSAAEHVRCRLGLTAMPNLQTAAGAYANSIRVEKDFADANWFAVCSKSSDPLVNDAETRVDMDVAVGTGWTWLRMRRKDAATISFSINGGTETDITTDIPTFALCPFAIVWTEAGSPATVYLDLDFFDMAVTFSGR